MNAHNDDTIYLVSCVSVKQGYPCAAKDLYQSDWFLKARRYVEAKGCPWFILSAKYGLVDPEKEIEPYEKTLNNMGARERRNWAAPVLEDLLKLDPCRFVFLAGARYRENLAAPLEDAGYEVDVPMEGMRIGEQLSWLQNCCASRARDD